MLKRDWFPLTRMEGEKKYPEQSNNIIPFLHPHIVKKGIELDLFNEKLIQEIEEIASLDKGYQIKIGNKEIENDHIFFPDYIPGLCIHPHKITPSGYDSGIYIEGNVAKENGCNGLLCSQKGLYRLPFGIQLNYEILKEYQMNQEQKKEQCTLRVQRGWHDHNVYEPVIIKSVVISLNNAIVRQIHSKQK